MRKGKNAMNAFKTRYCQSTVHTGAYSTRNVIQDTQGLELVLVLRAIVSASAKAIMGVLLINAPMLLINRY